MPKFQIPTIGNYNSKTTTIGLYFVHFEDWGIPAPLTSALFLARWTHGPASQHEIHSLFQIITSFLRVGPVSIITNRAMPWAVNCERVDKEIPWPNLSSPQILSKRGHVGFRAENIGINPSRLESGILLHKRMHVCGNDNF